MNIFILFMMCDIDDPFVLSWFCESTVTIFYLFPLTPTESISQISVATFTNLQSSDLLSRVGSGLTFIFYRTGVTN